MGLSVETLNFLIEQAQDLQRVAQDVGEEVEAESLGEHIAYLQSQLEE
jgi:hypothetical protein